MFYVKITPIIPTKTYWKGPFQSAEEGWHWVDTHNNPFVDYDVVESNEPHETLEGNLEDKLFTDE